MDLATLKLLAEVNSATLKSGDVISFNGGEMFSDAVLKCKTGVTYTSLGTGKAIIGDSIGTTSSTATIQVNALDVKIDNLKIYAYKDAGSTISYSVGNLTIEDCEIIGGQNSHDEYTNGIDQVVVTTISNVTIQRNIIHGFGQSGIRISRPVNFDISYNEMFNFWRKDALMNLGGVAISYRTRYDTDNETYDAEYTLRVHHNNIYNFEKSAFVISFSRVIFEYNEIHHNLDERIHNGGVKHGNIGKMYDADTDGGEPGTQGLVWRYNYIHDLVRQGEAGHVYDRADTLNPSYEYVTCSHCGRKARVVSHAGISPLTGQVYKNAVYLNSGTTTYGAHFGDGISDLGVSKGEGPDHVLSGMGYGNYWVHNNIFYNCSNTLIAGGGGISTFPFNSDLDSYFINNTVINCGWLEYITGDFGLIHSRLDAKKPMIIVNNIFDYTLPSSKTRMLGRYWEKETYLGYNIYLNQNGTANSVPNKGGNHASAFENTAIGTVPVSEFYLTDPNWADTSSTVFVSNLGVNGVYIPDVRIEPDGNASNKGKPYNEIGDNYLDIGGFQHELGKDPTGRSFAYDILGNYRTTNDIGAVGAAVSESMIPDSGLKVILEGSYLNGKMKTELNSSNLFPLHQPYNLSPWNINDTSSVNAIPNNYVDWILVELRDNLTNTKYSKPGLLTTDGKVINSDGSPFSFPYILSGQYYVLVRHRNHLSIMSSNKVQLDDYVIINYDFTDSQSKAFGENAMVDLGDGKFGMIAGDGNADGVINVLDYSTVANNILSRGYAQGDMDMNGVMNVLDYSFISRNILKKTNLP